MTTALKKEWIKQYCDDLTGETNLEQAMEDFLEPSLRDLWEDYEVDSVDDIGDIKRYQGTLKKDNSAVFEFQIEVYPENKELFMDIAVESL